jgi:uncharacterized membrane protein
MFIVLGQEELFYFYFYLFDIVLLCPFLNIHAPFIVIFIGLGKVAAGHENTRRMRVPGL